ncbi:MAG: 3-phosphoserine/phosphohydroxythreonine transaminase [Oligoflexales bacterium]
MQEEAFGISKHPALTGSLTPPSSVSRIRNFSPGPACLPQEVQHSVAKRCLSTNQLSSMYLSHRSPEFISILSRTKNLIKKVLEIPDSYEILFVHGGGHGQFCAVPLNLCPTGEEKATYLVSGTWSHRAVDEGKRYCDAFVVSSKNNDDTFTSFPSTFGIDPKSKYIHLCSNETVNGIELHRLPKLSNQGIRAPLVVDASSDVTTKPIRWIESNVGIFYACASKNIGHPGITLCVIRKDLIGQSNPICPGVLDYSKNVAAGNLWNTIATFNVEVVGLMMKWILDQGGIEEMESRSIQKSRLVYDLIDSSRGFYNTPLSSESERTLRSRMNIPFELANGDTDLTEHFLKESWEQGIVGLRTLTPFGLGRYLRASLYHGVSLEDTEFLVEFMTKFMRKQILH